MGRREDVAALIQTEYGIIREYESLILTSDRPEEKVRSQDQVKSRQMTLQTYLVEYGKLSRKLSQEVSPEIMEIGLALGVNWESLSTPMPQPVRVVSRWASVWLYGMVAVAAIFTFGVWRGMAFQAEETLSPLITPVMENPVVTSSNFLPQPMLTPSRGAAVRYHVLIAPFDARGEVSPVEIASRLADELKRELRSGSLVKSVEVTIWPAPVLSEAAAQDVVLQSGCDVLIWGWYDSLGIQVYLALGDQALTAVPNNLGVRELNLGVADEPEELSLYVHQVLPENTTFLTLFILGHLYYLDNQAREGQLAFDAAMRHIPEADQLENEGLWFFFKARLKHTTSLSNPVEIICSYAQAIEADPGLAEAYNNLGVLMIQLGNQQSIANSFFDTSPYEREYCLQAAQIKSLRPPELFALAIGLRPDWALAHYNLAVFNWTYARDWQIRDQLEKVVALDPAIPGAYLALGDMDVWDGNYDKAVERFSKAVELLPASPEVLHNLGQAWALNGKDAEAEITFRRALTLVQEEDDPVVALDIHVALGNLYHRQRNLIAAGNEYAAAQVYANKIKSGSRYYRKLNVLHLLQVKLAADLGNPTGALNLLNDGKLDGEMDAYLIWLIGSLEHPGDEGTLVNLRGKAMNSAASWTYGWVDEMTWWQISEDCSAIDGGVVAWSQGANGCLPEDLQAQLDYIYQRFQYNVHYQLFFNAQIPPAVGGDCLHISAPGVNSGAEVVLLRTAVGAAAERLEGGKLPDFNGRLRLSEPAAERVYVDRLYLRVQDEVGRWVSLMPELWELVADDGQYLVLGPGEQLDLQFVLPSGIPTGSVWVVAEGFTVPVSRFEEE